MQDLRGRLAVDTTMASLVDLAFRHLVEHHNEGINGCSLYRAEFDIFDTRSSGNSGTNMLYYTKYDAEPFVRAIATCDCHRAHEVRCAHSGIMNDPQMEESLSHLELSTRRWKVHPDRGSSQTW